MSPEIISQLFNQYQICHAVIWVIAFNNNPLYLFGRIRHQMPRFYKLKRIRQREFLVSRAGGSRTHMRLPSGDFKSPAYTSSATAPDGYSKPDRRIVKNFPRVILHKHLQIVNPAKVGVHDLWLRFHHCPIPRHPNPHRESCAYVPRPGHMPIVDHLS